MVKQISDNEIYLLIKYIKSVLWRVVKRLSYKQDAQCLKVNEKRSVTELNVICIMAGQCVKPTWQPYGPSTGVS